MTKNDKRQRVTVTEAYGPTSMNGLVVEIFRHESAGDDPRPTYWIVFVRFQPAFKLRRGGLYRLEVAFSVQNFDSQVEDVSFSHIAAFPQTSFEDLPNSNTVIDANSRERECELKPGYARAVANVQAIGSGIALMIQCQHCVLEIDAVVQDINPLSRSLRLWTTFSKKGRVVAKIGDEIQKSKLPALVWAAGNGWVEALKSLLESNPQDDKLRDSDGRSALSWAAGNGQIETTKLLLNKVEINLEDHQRRTALSWAAGNGHDQIVRSLLEKGASWNLDNQRRSPVWWAAEGGHDSVIQVMLDFSKNLQGGTAVSVDSPDVKGETPIMSAARNNHIPALRLLVDEGLKHNNEYGFTKQLTFIPFYLRKTAREGWVDLLEILMETNAIRDPATEYQAPLCLASQYGHKRVVELLLLAGANPDSKHEGDTALCRAIQNNHEDVVKLLLDSGAKTRTPGASGTPWELVKNNRTMLAMLTAASREGRLAERKSDTHPDTDQKFTATVYSFDANQSVTRFSSRCIPVNLLLENPRSSTSEPCSFQWIHLPANNMVWIELLMVKLYDNPNRAYQILKPERWVRRQHHGATGKPYARFMRPLCQVFTSTSTTLDPQSEIKDIGSQRALHRPELLCFMPFLHWDINGLRLSRERVLDNCSKVSGLSPQQELVRQYLKDTPHSLHIRRTLDQYYYHTLSDTEERDNSQVITRYQEGKEAPLRVISMVDQLWLWVLRGPEGRLDTVITCFPTVETSDERPPHPSVDPCDETDVLENIKRYLRSKPSSIRSAYDLASVIIGVCSRNYLDPGTTLDLDGREKGVQFSEIYETAIGDIMQRESTLFGEFKGKDINEVVEIKSEIALLYEIKDVLDELNIMAVLFQDQRRIFQTLDSFVQSITVEELMRIPTEASDDPKHSLIPATADNNASEDVPQTSSIKNNSSNNNKNSGSQVIQRKQSKAKLWGYRNDAGVSGLPMELVNASIDDVKGMVERAKEAQKALTFLVDLKFKHNNVIDSKQIGESEKQSVDLAKKTADLTRRITESTEATKRSVGETEKLTKKTKDLAEKADREGRTVMVFTIVTIIFLPLSFMATMFQLPISQYKRTGDKLDLGYVSSIMFPISTLVSVVLIVIAFKAENVENLFTKKKQVADEGDATPTPRGSNAPSVKVPPKGADAV